MEEFTFGTSRTVEVFNLATTVQGEETSGRETSLEAGAVTKMGCEKLLEQGSD